MEAKTDYLLPLREALKRADHTGLANIIEAIPGGELARCLDRLEEADRQRLL